ncbi:M10 family metallopeptidase C-terminal domain-containing protein [Rhizobium sp. GN54]|uniref:M10 family metallopeptidase C-terminal domain-containing protein n=1 Tax=Rhizobium sp. GN54 TaxID=2898150 RepID=UPI001E2AB0B4|nr:type I secretion C-terminal target domain-containing protein [Rhizobium sp. GN54]MCD2184738.1 type I secretion C-terminal target domain-containing protein [Rhizobium sp. GN54]
MRRATSFILKKATDSAASGTGRDTIYDFSRGQGDKIDLSAVDANWKASGNQAFKFIGDDDFNAKAGELRYEKKASNTYIYADINGDRKADFGIHLDDRVFLWKGDFIL